MIYFKLSIQETEDTNSTTALTEVGVLTPPDSQDLPIWVVSLSTAKPSNESIPEVYLILQEAFSYNAGKQEVLLFSKLLLRLMTIQLWKFIIEIQIDNWIC